MIHKRTFHDEDCFEFPCKHPKQWECTNYLAPMVHMSPPADGHQKPQTSDGDGEQNINRCRDQGRLLFGPVAEVSNGTEKEFEIGSDCISPLFWANGLFAEGDANSEEVYLSLFPEYFATEHQIRTFLQSDEIYSSHLDHPPVKSVSIGPEYQADVPEWCLQGSKNSLAHLDGSDHQVRLERLSGSCLVVDDVQGEKLLGTCVVSMPDSAPSANYYSQSLVTRNDCECLDKGSIRCVRQHVMEAREKLRVNLGHKIFEELGFHEMGEEVSKNWTKEEENKFHEVVSSYPVSMGKNFWDHLSLVFPSRTKNELVSYYFNVFILQKRAEQNRFDPLNIDSDDDEWQRCDLGAAEEDEESGVEFLSNRDVSAYQQDDHVENCQDDTEGGYLIDDCKNDANVVHTVATDEEEDGDVDDVPEPHVRDLFSHSSTDT